jgi:NAD(P)-dependent dehydrogenase (short-subunit alcohol dehydrogenase family)
MTTTLITGANKGLGRETARQLIAAGHTVYAGARDEQRGKEAAAALGARFLLLDVTSDESAAAAAAQLRAEAGGLDVLVNNAGVPGGRTPPGNVTGADVQRVYETNVFGVVRVTHAFLPLLQASDAPVIVNVSSGLGSFGVTTSPDRMQSHAAAPRPSRRGPRSSSGWPRSARTGPPPRPAATSTGTAQFPGKHGSLVNTVPW